MSAAEIPELDNSGLRSFGLTTGAIIAVLFGLLLPYLFGATWPVWPWIIFAVLAVWALVAPSTLNPVYRGWMRFGLALSKITTPIILTLVFVIAILPASIMLRLLSKDPMRRTFDDSADTYRIQSRRPSVENLEKPY